MGGAGASGTHSLASSTVFSLFFMVSFVFVSIIVIVSLRTVQHVGGGWHAQRVDDACASRAAKVASALQSAFAPDVPAASRPTVSQWPVTRARQPSFDVSERMASAFALQLCARWLSSGPADSQPVACDTRNHMMLLCVCKCMLLCECMCASLARHACVQRACRACCACVCSRARRRAERRHAGKDSGDLCVRTLSVCARFSVCTRFSVRNPLKARFLQIGKVWSHFGKISKRKALGHSAKGCRTCHRRAHRSRGSCCSSSSSGARWMQLGGARSRTHERGTPARLCDRSARLSYTALTARGGILKNLGEK